MRGKMIAGAAVAGVAGLVPAVSQAALLDYQLRINGALGTDTVGSPTKYLPSVTIGQVVTLDLYAVLNGGDGTRTNDGFQRTNGSFGSSNGGILGNFRGDAGTANTQQNNVSPFKGTTALAGRSSDLDGDGDLDVGSLVTSGSVSPFPWFEALSDTNTTAQFGSGAGNVLEQLIGQILFTVTGGDPNSQNTSLNYIPRFRTDGGASGPRLNLFNLDGDAYVVNALGAGTKNGSSIVSGTLSVGTPVVLGLVPEPASLGLLGIGAAALLRRRKA